MGMDIRVPPSVPKEQIMGMLDEWVKEAGQGASWRFAPWTDSDAFHVSLFCIFSCDVIFVLLRYYVISVFSRDVS
jgi:hypothetical protein